MADRFRLIAITPEQTLPDEAERIQMLVGAGFDYVHVRKPQMTEEEVHNYLQSLPASLLPRLKMHYFPNLAQQFQLGGLHLNSRCPATPDGYQGRLSRSCHTIAETQCCAGMEYVFLSPIFDSISKVGYSANFSEADLRKSVDRKIVALGGVTADRIPWLNDVGFGGCAFLGYLFGVDGDEFRRRIEIILNERNKLK